MKRLGQGRNKIHFVELIITVGSLSDNLTGIPLGNYREHTSELSLRAASSVNSLTPVGDTQGEVELPPVTSQKVRSVAEWGCIVQIPFQRGPAV